MEVVIPTTTTSRPSLLTPNAKPAILTPPTSVSFRTKTSLRSLSTNASSRTLTPLSSSPSPSIPSSTATTATPTTITSPSTHWVVVMDRPPAVVGPAKSDLIDHYVRTLARVLGSEKEAQACIYGASCETQYGFCCDVDEETAMSINSLPGVLSVRPDTDFESAEKDYSFSGGGAKHWVVRMEKPGVGVITKAQMVDFYANSLTKVLGNEKDAQVCMYHISWEDAIGFCCEIDEECARELAGLPGVLSVKPDTNFDSPNKDYGGVGESSKSIDLVGSSDSNQPPNVKTKRLFVTGLSFYTSEKTLRAAFEGFGELVEVKIIMDKISKRSKGYAFLEYTTEEAAGAALKEMNGKIINGWMIVVDVAKTNPPRYSRERPRPSSASPFSH